MARRRFNKREERDDSSHAPREAEMDAWQPKTELGKKVKSGEIKTMDQVLDSKLRIMEAKIVDMVMPNLNTELLLIGQSKGKFGGGQRRVFRQTQKKTKEGNKPHFSTLAIIGNMDGYVGMGYGKSKETVPAREKALRNAKVHIIRIIRGNGSWQDFSTEPTSIPYTVQGKCGSVIIKLIPAPRGTGLRVEKECAKILRLAGIKDVWSKTYGKSGTKLNLIYACFEALKNLSEIKVQKHVAEKVGVVEGSAVQ